MSRLRKMKCFVLVLLFGLYGFNKKKEVKLIMTMLLVRVQGIRF